jgi:hypothetical protein
MIDIDDGDDLDYKGAILLPLITRASTLILSKTCLSPSPCGVPCPSLYKLKGRLTCSVLVGLQLVSFLLQAGH